MNPERFAVIGISSKRKYTEEELQEIESRLRRYERVSNFSTNAQEINFHIWSDGKIDYRIVEELREFLKQKQKRNPKITAVEYVKQYTKSF